MAETQEIQRQRYMAYLLRLWQVSDGAPRLWRASLERPQGGKRLGFASLVDLFVFLENEAGSGSGGGLLPDAAGSHPSDSKA